MYIRNSIFWKFMLTCLGITTLLWATVACRTDVRSAVPYAILEDNMGDRIAIGVKGDITKEQLLATLTKAANEHQNDEARDYVGLNLVIEAYLADGNRKSEAIAGRLLRPIPLKNPAERKRMKDDRSRFDSVTISLEKAEATLK